MIAAIAPFIIGVILQLGGAVGVYAVGADFGAASTELERKARDEARNAFARRADAAQAVAASAALVISGLLVPALANLDRSIYLALSILVGFSAYAWISRQSDNDYWNRGIWILSPLNIGLIAANVMFGAIALLLAA